MTCRSEPVTLDITPENASRSLIVYDIRIVREDGSVASRLAGESREILCVVPLEGNKNVCLTQVNNTESATQMCAQAINGMVESAGIRDSPARWKLLTSFLLAVTDAVFALRCVLDAE